MRDSGVKRRAFRKDFTQLTLEPAPKVLNRIKVWRVWRQEQQSMPQSFRNGNKPAFPVESGVVHHNHSVLGKHRQQYTLKPQFKQCTVHRSVVLQRSNDGLAHLRRDNPHTLVFPSAHDTVHRFPTFGSAILTVQIPVDSRLINVYDLLCGYVSYTLPILCYACGVLLPVAVRLFLRVIPNLFKAFLTAASPQPNTSAISVR